MRLVTVQHGALVTFVEALSPSSASVAAAIGHLSRSSLEAGRELQVPRPDHNAAAVVLHIRSGDVGALLASDLEMNTDPARGWRAVVEVGGQLDNRSDIVKIPHHGSSNADAADIWDQLLKARPIGMLTHFHNGSVHLPVAAQLQAISSRCSGLFSTSGPAWKPKALTAEEAAELLAHGESHLSVPVGLGHVRVRIKPGLESQWRVSVCGSAALVAPPAIASDLHSRPSSQVISGS